MAGRRCVYTVVCGGYEQVLEQHIARQYDTDLICFTDGEVPAGSAWQVRPLELVLPADQNRSSRYPKLLAHRVLPDYDESLYIDNTVLLTADPAVTFDRFLPPGVGMAAFAHGFRDTVRDEFDEVVRLGKDAAWVCEEQRRHYEAVDPEALDLRPVKGTLIWRRHHDPVVQQAMELWWVHVLRYSRRDQLSLRVAARAAGLNICIHQVDNRVSDIHEWPRWSYRDNDGGAPLAPGPEGRIAGLVSDVAEAELLATHLRAQLELERQQHDEQLFAQRAEMEATTSWRVTRPLRAAKDQLQRLRRR